MSSHHALIWLDHRSAYVIHLDRETESITSVVSHHGKEHLHHKADAVGDGNIKPHADYFRDVLAAIGDSTEIILTGPADAKTEFLKFAEQHQPALAKCIVKVKALDRITTGELIDHARHFFSMIKPRLGPHHQAQ